MSPGAFQRLVQFSFQNSHCAERIFLFRNIMLPGLRSACFDWVRKNPKTYQWFACQTLLLGFCHLATWDCKSLCNGVWARQFYHWLCPSFFMDHMAVNYLRNLKLVRLDTIRVQDDFLVGQMPLSNGLPFLFSDRSRSWSSPLCHGWLQLEELQRFWPSSFNKPSPLLPYHGVVAFYLQIFFSQVYLVCFYIRPNLRWGSP